MGVILIIILFIILFISGIGMGLLMYVDSLPTDKALKIDEKITNFIINFLK